MMVVFLRFLVPVLLGLVLTACVSAPRAPANNPFPAAPPSVETSVISVPLTVDLEQLRTEVLKQLPSPVQSGTETQVLRVRFNPGGASPVLEPGTCSLAELNCLQKKAVRALAVDYTAPMETVIHHQVFIRDLAMSMTGNQFSITAEIEFAVNTRMKSGLTQFGLASCGVNEVMPRIEFTLTGQVGWGPQGDIVVTPRPYTMKWLRPCNITAFQLNVETLLNLPLLREKLQMTIHEAVFSGLKQVSLRSLLTKVWPELNAPRELAESVWLLPRPMGLAFADIVGNGRYVSTGVLVRAHPEVVSGPKPVVNISPVPSPERGINGNGVYLALRGDIALATAEKLLGQKLVGKPMKVGSHVVQVDAIRLYGHEDKAVLGLTLSQPVHAEIFVLGKPVFDVEKNEVRFEKLSYSLGTRDFLVKTANWLSGDSFRNTLQQKARFRFDDDLVDALKEFRDYQQDVGFGFVLHGGVNRVRPQALYFTRERLLAYVIVEGGLALEMKKSAK